MQHAHLDCALGHRDFGESVPGDQQPGSHKHCFTFHKLNSYILRFTNSDLHLDLEADSRLPEISSLSIESCVFEERHHARIELLDDVIEIHFCGFLVIAWAYSVRKLRLSILPEDLELTHADRFRKEVASK